MCYYVCEMIFLNSIYKIKYNFLIIRKKLKFYSSIREIHCSNSHTNIAAFENNKKPLINQQLMHPFTLIMNQINYTETICQIISLIVQLRRFSIIYGPVEPTVPTWSTVHVTLLLIKTDIYAYS